MHPLSFGVAMLVAFLHWMVNPPDGSWLSLAVHFGTDAAVAGAMVAVAELTSVGGSALRYFAGRVPSALSRPWLDVHHQVRDGERGHVVLSRVAAFIAACTAFEVGSQRAWEPLPIMMALIASFLAAQATVLVVLRPRAQKKLARALEGHRAALPPDRFEALAALFNTEAAR